MMDVVRMLATLLVVLGGLHLTRSSSGQVVVRRNLERDILRHTIHYLKTKLVKCLRETPSTRHKRKVHHDPSPFLDFEVDMAVLRNTKDFLMQKVVVCHSALADSHQPIQGYISALGKARNKHSHTDYPDLSTDAPSTTTTTTSTTTTTMTTTTTTPTTTTTETPKPLDFSVEGRTISCEHGEWRDGGRVLRCRNLRVDEFWRLPNWDICMPGYNANAWRQLDEIQPATFKVLDLKSFCRALGNAVNMVAAVTNVRVCWDCAETEDRLSWLGGKWTGTVKDNGFLRDIECSFDSSVTIS